MIKKWIACMAIYGLCSIAAPGLVSADSPNSAYLAETQAMTETGEDGGGKENDKEDEKIPAYQAKESKNAQGLTVIANPRWDYNKSSKTYKLVKTQTSTGATAYYDASDGVLQHGGEKFLEEGGQELVLFQQHRPAGPE